MASKARSRTGRWAPRLKPLRVLSLRQPWAWLIVNGYKDIENRSWRTNHRGPLLIHASSNRSLTSSKNLAALCQNASVEVEDSRQLGLGSGKSTTTSIPPLQRGGWVLQAETTLLKTSALKTGLSVPFALSIALRTRARSRNVFKIRELCHAANSLGRTNSS